MSLIRWIQAEELSRIITFSLPIISTTFLRACRILLFTLQMHVVFAEHYFKKKKIRQSNIQEVRKFMERLMESTNRCLHNPWSFVFAFFYISSKSISFSPFVMTSYSLTFRQTTFSCYYGFPNNKRKWSSRIILTEAHIILHNCSEEFKLYTWKLLEGARCHIKGTWFPKAGNERLCPVKKRSSLWGVQCMHLNSSHAYTLELHWFSR